MIPLVNAYSPQYLESVGKSRLKTLAHNSKVYLHNFLQDTGRIRKESYIFATALMIAMSCMVAYSSAIKAKGTPDEYHRSSEFSKTLFRRVLAFFITFSCLRYIEAATSQALRRYFAVIVQEPPTKLWKNIFMDLRKLLSGKRIPIAERLIYPGDSGFRRIGRIGMVRFSRIEDQWYANLLVPDKKVTMKPRDRLKLFIARAAMMVGSIPTIIVSGPLLERYNQSKIEDYFAGLLLPPGEYTASKNGRNAQIAGMATGVPATRKIRVESRHPGLDGRDGPLVPPPQPKTMPNPLQAFQPSRVHDNGFNPFLEGVIRQRVARQLIARSL